MQGTLELVNGGGDEMATASIKRGRREDNTRSRNYEIPEQENGGSGGMADSVHHERLVKRG